MAHNEKLDRAKIHLHSLERILSDWIESEPYDLIRKRNADDTEEVTEAKGRTPIPPETPLLVGEIIYNLRSSLDHLAFALSARHTKVGLDEDAISFPIQRDKSAFAPRGAGTRALSQMDPAAANIIKTMQPCEHPSRMNDHLLGILNQLSNVDKHRKLTFVGSVNMGTSIRINPRSRDVQVNAVAISHGLLGFEEQAEVARVSWIKTGPNPYVEVDVDFICDPAFPKGGPAAGEIVLTKLAEIFVNIDTEVFPRFDRFLK